MITPEIAENLAKEFCRSKGEIAKNLFYSIGAYEDLGDYFYFDFKFIDRDGNPSGEGVGGAPGFTISKDAGDVKIIGWQQYRELRNKSN